MRIGIDIDDTLVDTSKSFENIKIKYKLDFNKKYQDEWTEEEWDFLCKNHLKEILVSATIKEDAREVIEYLSSLGYELFIITARGNKNCKGIEKNTIEFIKRENLKIDKIYFGKYKKSDLAKRLNLDLMIDDSKFVYNNMKKENIDCILFGDKIKTWKEVLEYIKRKEQNHG